MRWAVSSSSSTIKWEARIIFGSPSAQSLSARCSTSSLERERNKKKSLASRSLRILLPDTRLSCASSRETRLWNRGRCSIRTHRNPCSHSHSSSSCSCDSSRSCFAYLRTILSVTPAIAASPTAVIFCFMRHAQSKSAYKPERRLRGEKGERPF